MSYTGEPPLKKKQTDISSFFSKVPAQSEVFAPPASQSECPKEIEVGVERILQLGHELCGQPNTSSSAKQATEIAPGSHLNPMYDIAKYDNHFTLADTLKYNLLLNHIVPRKSSLPGRLYQGYKRTFNLEWLKQYNWLVYSPSTDGAFCAPCVLFGCEKQSSGKLDHLYRSPLVNWKSASTKLKEHQEKSEFHKNSVAMATSFKEVYERKTVPVIEMQSTIVAARVQKNREILKSVFKTVIFCGRQGRPLRGHRGESVATASTEVNSGDFLALL